MLSPREEGTYLDRRKPVGSLGWRKAKKLSAPRQNVRAWRHYTARGGCCTTVAPVTASHGSIECSRARQPRAVTFTFVAPCEPAEPDRDGAVTEAECRHQWPDAVAVRNLKCRGPAVTCCSRSRLSDTECNLSRPNPNAFTAARPTPRLVLWKCSTSAAAVYQQYGEHLRRDASTQSTNECGSQTVTQSRSGAWESTSEGVRIGCIRSGK